MKKLLLAGGVALAIVAVVALVGLNAETDDVEAQDAVLETTLVAPTQPSATEPAATPTVPATTTTSSPSCEPTMVPHVVAKGWYDSLTPEPLAEAGYIGDRFYMANVVEVVFPVDGGPVYFYGTALWTVEPSFESTSVLASADSRAADPIGSPTAPEHILLFDAGTGQIGGTGTIAAAVETLDPENPTIGQTPWVPSGFEAVYDGGAGEVTGQVVHPDASFTFRAPATVEDRNSWPSAECYRQALEGAIEADQP